jgi:hypothetical protein
MDFLRDANHVWRFQSYFGVKKVFKMKICNLLMDFAFCRLSTFNQHCIACAGLPPQMMGKVSWDPVRRRSWASKYSILSAAHLQYFFQLLAKVAHKKKRLCTGIWWN